MAGAPVLSASNYCLWSMATMPGTFQPSLNQAVRVSQGIAFGGGSSPWQGRKGVVKKLLTARACMVLLEGDIEAMLFFNRELDADTTS